MSQLMPCALEVIEPEVSMAKMSEPSVFVGRQQIYDRELNVVGYELLFRSNLENHATILDADIATSQLLINSVVEIGLENLTFGLPAFVNFPKNFILGNHDIPFGPELLVVELLETIDPDPEIIAAVGCLRDKGYTIALDDYAPSDIRVELLCLADIVKIDLREYTPKDLEQEVRRLKRLPLKLLAEKVESKDEFDRCHQLGFDYFQGYFLSRPQVVEAKTIANNQLAILQLLVKLRDPYDGPQKLDQSLR